MRCLNRVQISGLVSSEVFTGSTPSGEAYTFYITCHRDPHPQTRVKVNAYGVGLGRIIAKRVHEGAYIIVNGELMGRAQAGYATVEIRAHELLFVED